MQKPVEFYDVESAKSYVNSGGISYPRPLEYAEKFMDILEVNEKNCRFELQGLVENANEDSSTNKAYARFLVETKLEHQTEELQKTIGMVVNFDTQSPKIKVYSGDRVMACTNLLIAGAEQIYDQSLNSGVVDNAYTQLRYFRKNAEEDWNKEIAVWTKMKETELEGNQIEERLGKFLHLVITSNKFKYLGTTPIVQAAKYLYSNSPYMIKDNKTSAWGLYQAVTQSITNANDIVKTPMKTLIATNLILN